LPSFWRNNIKEEALLEERRTQQSFEEDNLVIDLECQLPLSNVDPYQVAILMMHDHGKIC
jgi:hypothetical protein